MAPTLNVYIETKSQRFNLTERSELQDGKPLAIESLTIKWGSDHLLEKHTPATATVTAFVPYEAKTFTAFLMRNEGIATLRIRVGVRDRFLGFIQHVHARMGTYQGQDCYIFDIEASDVTAVLGRFRLDSTWPKYLEGEAAIRWINREIRNHKLAPYGLGDIDTPVWLRNNYVMVDGYTYGKESIKDVIDRVFAANHGIGWQYDPNQKKITERSALSPLFSLRLERRKDGFIYTSINPDNALNSGGAQYLQLPECELALDEIGFDLTKYQAAGAVEVSYFDHDNDFSEESIRYDAGTELDETISLDTALVYGNTGALSGVELATAFAKEAYDQLVDFTYFPQTPDVTYRFTSLPTQQQYDYWLNPFSSNLIGLIGNSILLKWINSSPIPKKIPSAIAPVGGTITFDGERWSVTHRSRYVGFLQRVDKPVTYDTLNDGGAHISDYNDAFTWQEFESIPRDNIFERT